MERRMISRLLKVAAAMLLLAALIVCSNPIDITASIKDQVMVANNKYLVITNAAPAKNATNVNPSDPIWITLDRDLDQDSVTTDAVTFSPAATWTSSYNDATRTLFIQPDSLNGATSYTVKFTGSLKGTDGSSLQSPYIISFSTANLPSGSIKINNGDTNTLTNVVNLTTTFNNVATYMRITLDKTIFTNPAYDNSYWVPVSSSAGTIDLGASSSNYGTRTVYIQFRDSQPTPNLTSATNPLNDSIIYGKPVITSVSPNTSGVITLGWSTLPKQDSGTNYYRVYRKVAPSVLRMLYTLVAETTGGSAAVTTPREQAYYFRVAIYNSAVGTVYADDIPVSFSSDIAVVYNSGDSTDTSLASSIKSVLQNGDGWKSTYGVSGTMPSWTVTLVPQNLISTTYASIFQVYGYPVIVTPGVTNYSNLGWVQNIAANGKGLIAMGSGGAQMLDTITANWSSWGLSGQAPNQIGWGASMLTGALQYGNAKTVSVWNAPLYKTTLSDGQRVLIGNALTRVAVYRSAGTAPTGGYLYCSEDGSTTYFNTVQQGRFVQYGFNGLAGVGYPAWLYSFWVNLAYRMGANYYP